MQYRAAQFSHSQSDKHNMEEKAREFEVDIRMIKTKIHRYPATIKDLGAPFTVPIMVAIGPYHHGRDQLKATESEACGCLPLHP